MVACHVAWCGHCCKLSEILAAASAHNHSSWPGGSPGHTLRGPATSPCSTHLAFAASCGLPLVRCLLMSSQRPLYVSRWSPGAGRNDTGGPPPPAAAAADSAGMLVPNVPVRFVVIDTLVALRNLGCLQGGEQTLHDGMWSATVLSGNPTLGYRQQPRQADGCSSCAPQAHLPPTRKLHIAPPHRVAPLMCLPDLLSQCMSQR